MNIRDLSIYSCYQQVIVQIHLVMLLCLGSPASHAVIL